MIGPIVFWAPSIAPSGMAFYTGDRFPEWKNNVLVGALLGGAVQGVGHLERIIFNQNWDETGRQSLLTDLKQRIRDVRQGPDGLVYVLTDEDNGALMRLEPAQESLLFAADINGERRVEMAAPRLPKVCLRRAPQTGTSISPASITRPVTGPAIRLSRTGRPSRAISPAISSPRMFRCCRQRSN